MLMTIIATTLFVFGGNVCGQVAAQLTEAKSLVAGIAIMAVAIAVPLVAAVFLDPAITVLDTAGYVVAFSIGTVLGWKQRTG